MVGNGFWRWPKALKVRPAALTVLLAVLLAGAGLQPELASAKKPAPSVLTETVKVSQLPAQAQGMMALIAQGGPFRYEKDGTVFGNRENLLARQNRGYYREYTVKTPNERTRGARRIVCGGLKPAAPDACFYTDDHYASFRKIVQ